ncbi:hypothetical protein Q7L73_28615, partial [Conexibacter sp. CPCC 205762]
PADAAPADAAPADAAPADAAPAPPDAAPAPVDADAAPTPAEEAMRARLLARLSVDRSWADPAEAERLALAAGESAEASAGELPLRMRAQVELALIGSRRDPARARGRLDAADGLAARARAEGDRAVELAALLQSLSLLGELGRAAAVRDTVARIEQLASALGDHHALRLAADTRLVAAELAGAGSAPGFAPLAAPSPAIADAHAAAARATRGAAAPA